MAEISTILRAGTKVQSVADILIWLVFALYFDFREQVSFTRISLESIRIVRLPELVISFY